MSRPTKKSKNSQTFYRITGAALLGLLLLFIPYFISLTPQLATHSKTWPLYVQIALHTPLAFLLGFGGFGVHFFMKHMRDERRKRQKARRKEPVEKELQEIGVKKPENAAKRKARAYDMAVMWDAEEVSLEDVELGGLAVIPKLHI